MDNDELTADQLFGRAVLESRQAREISQRAFAELLTEAGMPVDASAVSRIEKGTRSVRLTEALTIAQVLNLDLSDLVQDTQTPEQIFARQRRFVDITLQAFEEAGLAAAHALADIHYQVQNEPRVLEAARDERFDQPRDADSYLRWVAARWRANTEVEGPELVLTTKAGAELMRNVLHAVADGVVDALDEDDDDEH
ncbi:helix-turn-helix domain-containing protein [Curtobacterium sp. ISL-83]|uniref:helix-turn-helix domain-containing protein n=1 Tax=Curtobacterium sp. ISL-83 TaxID=2819145 RepID=UPI001BEC6A91|nr:helix-turn-helix transcriptional regulator [Curtobacterium sp. ISL-83]MBT2501414.1 helix-turn-helix transcriptional regulator [Curtobacterium sp. ISL-83]